MSKFKIKFSPRGNMVLATTMGLVVGAGAMGQIKIMQVVKILGVGAAVAQFGPQINTEISKVAKTQDTGGSLSKVVPIISGGINSRTAIGAAQVRGPIAAVKTVNAVAEIDQNLFGEIKVQILIPIASKQIVQDLKAVPFVGVTGVVNLRV